MLLLQVYPDGKMSQHVDKLKVGDSLDFKGEAADC
jgi:NAD(P)H-flavin reductase